MGITKTMKMLEFQNENYKNHENHRSPYENHENHENHIIRFEKHENHANLRIP